MIVISMKILRDFVKSVPGHNIFYREITKKFLIRPVHFCVWQVYNTHIRPQTYVSLYFRNSDWCPCGIGFQPTAWLSVPVSFSRHMVKKSTWKNHLEKIKFVEQTIKNDIWSRLTNKGTNINFLELRTPCMQSGRLLLYTISVSVTAEAVSNICV